MTKICRFTPTVSKRYFSQLILELFTYGSETMCLTKTAGNILRKKLGPKNIQVNEYRTRWYEHVYRRYSDTEIENASKWTPLESRLRWEDQIIIDLLRMDIKDWAEIIKDGKKWKIVAEKAKTDKRI